MQVHICECVVQVTGQYWTTFFRQYICVHHLGAEFCTSLEIWLASELHDLPVPAPQILNYKHMPSHPDFPLRIFKLLLFESYIHVYNEKWLYMSMQLFWASKSNAIISVFLDISNVALTNSSQVNIPCLLPQFPFNNQCRLIVLYFVIRLLTHGFP